MPPLSHLEVILAIVTIVGLIGYGLVALYLGIDGAVTTAILGAILGTLMIIVLRKIPGA